MCVSVRVGVCVYVCAFVCLLCVFASCDVIYLLTKGVEWEVTFSCERHKRGVLLPLPLLSGVFAHFYLCVCVCVCSSGAREFFELLSPLLRNCAYKRQFSDSRFPMDDESDLAYEKAAAVERDAEFIDDMLRNIELLNKTPF